MAIRRPSPPSKPIEDVRVAITVVDDPDRENEGDLVIAAQFATPEAINFMATHGRADLPRLTTERARTLGLRPMTDRNEAPLGTDFTVSIEAREGVTTGISAADRSHTIQVAIAPDTRPDDLVQPGHVFPLRAKPGGVLERIGQTEAAVDLARLAGLIPSGVVCEIMNDDGTMARVPTPYGQQGSPDDHGRRPGRTAAGRSSSSAGVSPLPTEHEFTRRLPGDPDRKAHLTLVRARSTVLNVPCASPSASRATSSTRSSATAASS
jgi:3,4-dihydroxy-2-butanone 4-phosphate synthase